MSAEKFETDHMSLNRSLEKGPTELEQVAPAEDRYHFDKSDLDRVQRRLKQRHVQMLVFYFIFLT
jgi:amino acid transporter